MTLVPLAVFRMLVASVALGNMRAVAVAGCTAATSSTPDAAEAVDNVVHEGKRTTDGAHYKNVCDIAVSMASVIDATTPAARFPMVYAAPRRLVLSASTTPSPHSVSSTASGTPIPTKTPFSTFSTSVSPTLTPTCVSVNFRASQTRIVPQNGEPIT